MTLRASRTLSGFERSKRRFALMVAVPVLLYMLFWTVIPYLWVVLLSFFEYSPRRVGGGFLGLGGDNPFVGLRHYAEMLNFGEDASHRVQLFRRAFGNTAIFSLLVVPLNLAITIPLAVLVSGIKRRHTANAFRTVFFTPVITSSVGVGIIWTYIFNPQRGILNMALSGMAGHRIAISWLRDANLDILGVPLPLLSVLVAYLWMDMGYNFIIFLAGLQAIPQTVVEASEIDGASSLQQFRRIIVPLLAPQILLTSVLTMISAFQIYDLVQVMTEGGPNNLTRVVILDIFLNAFRHQRMGLAAAESIVFFIVVLVFSIVQTRLMRQNWEY